MTAEEPAQIRFASGCHSIATLLAKYRPYLRLLAARKLGGVLATRLSASDIVQQTQLDAFRGYGLFRGNTEEEFVAWLKAILTNNVARATQTHIVAKKRSVKREQPLASGDAKPTHAFAGNEDSPSAAAMQGESAVALAQAMEKLTERQYEAIRLRYIEGSSLANIAERMNCTQPSVAGLLKRGLRDLRDSLADGTER